jgi:deoxycytidine triphosphate deaminase
VNAPLEADLNYWREPPDKHLEPAYWNDPWPELQGMLTAERIVEYHKAIGGKDPDSDIGAAYGMIRPFELRLLKSASYELSLGSRCVVEGKEVLLSEKEPRLHIPKNSIVFVSMQQVLCLPHYLVGRFDLAIDFIYRGLLLGTGPQVDPGFQGGLSCPLHNISNEDIELRFGEPFAKIDFVKTVPRDPGIREQWSKISSEEQLEKWLHEDIDSNVKLFKEGKPKWREPIFGYTMGHQPMSSVQQVTDEVQQAKGEVQRATEAVHRLRRIGVVGAIVGAVTLTLAVAALVIAALQLNGGVTDAKQELQKVKDCQAAIAQKYEAVEAGMSETKKLALHLLSGVCQTK